MCIIIRVVVAFMFQAVCLSALTVQSQQGGIEYAYSQLPIQNVQIDLNRELTYKLAAQLQKVCEQIKLKKYENRREQPTVSYEHECR